MRVILLAGYKDYPAKACPWLEDENGLPRLEARLRAILQVTNTCIVVLGGPAADEVLRRCPAIERCELVFDTTTTKPNLISNLRAALRLGHDPALVLPVDLPLPNPMSLKALVSSAVQQGALCPAHILQGVTASGALMNGGFPFVLTLAGAKEISDNRALTSLGDPGLQRMEIAVGA